MSKYSKINATPMIFEKKLSPEDKNPNLYGQLVRCARARASAITRAAACSRARGSAHTRFTNAPGAFRLVRRERVAWRTRRSSRPSKHCAPYQSQDVDPIKARMLNVEGNASPAVLKKSLRGRKTIFPIF